MKKLLLALILITLFPTSSAQPDYDKSSKPYIGRRIVMEAHAQGFKAAWALAVMEVESTWNPKAERPEKKRHTKSVGLFQLFYPTAVEMEKKRGTNRVTSFESLHDVDLNVELGIEHLVKCQDKFGANLEKILCCYNAGPSATEACNSGWVQHHIAKVTKSLSKYRRVK